MGHQGSAPFWERVEERRHPGRSGNASAAIAQGGQGVGPQTRWPLAIARIKFSGDFATSALVHSAPSALAARLFMTVAALFIGASNVGAADALVGTEWMPVEIAGQPVAEAADSYIRFESEGEVIGNGGCNNFRGRYLTNAGAILFGPLASTMMMCDDAKSILESSLLQAIDQARGFSLTGAELELSGSSGHVLLRLRQRNEAR